MTALTDSILMIGIVLTALLFAFSVHRLLVHDSPLPPTLIAGVIAYLIVSPMISAIAAPPGRSDRASCRLSGLSSAAWQSRSSPA